MSSILHYRLGLSSLMWQVRRRWGLLGLLFLSSTIASAQCPSISANAERSVACLLQKVSFEANGIPSGSEVTWDFGIDSISGKDLSKISIPFVLPGTWDLSLRVTGPDEQTCKYSFPEIVEILVPVVPEITVSKETICDLPEEITIGADGTNANRIDWIVGGKTYLNEKKKLRHEVTSEGYKSISLELVDDAGCRVTKTIDSAYFAMSALDSLGISVIGNPSGCGQKSVNLQVSKQADSKWLSAASWALPDALPSSASGLAIPSVYYAAPGEYDALLELTYGNGCAYTIDEPKLVTVEDASDLEITINKAVLCANEEINIRSQGALPKNAELIWDFDGAQPDTSFKGKLQKVTYPVAGSYNVSLTQVSNGCTSKVALVDTITVHELSAEITLDYSCGCGIPDTIRPKNLSKSSLGNIDFTWQVIDKNTGARILQKQGAEPELIVNRQGDFSVKLLSNSNMGCSAETKKDYSIQKLEAAFFASKEYACVGEEIDFNVDYSVSCENGLNFWRWLFYDENMNLIGSQDAEEGKFAWDKEGVFSVGLVLGNQKKCSDTLIKRDFIRIYKVRSDFSVQNASTCTEVNNEVRALTTPSDVTMDYYWQMREASTGATVTGSGEAFNFEFDEPGIYSVTLISGHETVCADTLVTAAVFEVSGIKADFSTSQFEGCLPLSNVLVSSISKNLNLAGGGNSVTYEWTANSADIELSSPNASSTQYNTNKNGAYDISLKVENEDGCSFTVSKDAFIKAGVIADFEMPAKGCKSINLTLLNKSELGANDFRWSFTPSASDILPSVRAKDPVVRFDQLGTYVAELKVKNHLGCEDTKKASLEIIDFEFDFNTFDGAGTCSPAFVRFNGQSTNVDSFIWKYGDGTIIRTTDDTVAHVYDLSKMPVDFGNRFDVALIAKSDYGCADTLIKKDLVTVWSPRPLFGATPLSSTGETKVSFENKSRDVVSFTFNYGDGSLRDSNAIKDHTYKIDANIKRQAYSPHMIAWDDNGCSALYQLPDSIVIYNSPVPNFIADKYTGCGSLKVQFASQSEFAKKIYWDFENDGTIDDSSSFPVYTFGEGNHSVRLIAENEIGYQVEIIEDNIIKVNQSPVLDFDFTTEYICTSTNVQFLPEVLSKTAVSDFTWHFGTGDSSELKTPYYSYNTEGLYSVTLTGVDALGCKGSVTKQDVIKVNPEIVLWHKGISHVSYLEEDKVSIVLENSRQEGIKSFFIRYLSDTNSVKRPCSNCDPTEKEIRQISQEGYTGQYSLMLAAVDECNKSQSLGSEHKPVKLSVDSIEGTYFASLKWTQYVGWNVPFLYEVQRAHAGGPFEKLTTLGQEDSTYLDSNLCDGDYSYRILAVNADRDSASSQKVNYTPAYFKPSGRVDLSAVSVNEDDLLELSWAAFEQPRIDAYIIDRREEGQNWKELARTRSNKYLDLNAEHTSTRYQYRVTMVDKCGYRSDKSRNGENLLVNSYKNLDNVVVNWSNYTDTESQNAAYVIQRRTLERGLEDIQENSPGDSTLMDKEILVQSDDQIEYRVMALIEGHKTPSFSGWTLQNPKLSIHIPNAFSPNGDGTNDRFIVETAALLKENIRGKKAFEMSIYNRFGQLVFQSQDANEGWDGSFQGKPAEQGVYALKVVASNMDGESQTYSGSVTLIK